MPMSPRLLRPRSSVVFDPRRITGLALWMDAADTSYNASTGTWTDKSGNGRNFSQATPANRPIVSAVTQNGRSILEFDGTNDQLIHNSNFLQIANCTMFAAFRRLGGVFGGVIASSGNADRSPGIVIDSSRVGIRGFLNVSLGAAAAADSFNVTSGTVADGTAVMFTNGTPISVTAASNSLLADQATTAIGTYRTTAANYLNGYIGEIIVYNRVLSAAERQAVESYLGRKWSVAVSQTPAVSNADAQDWINRVYINGGTVSTSTAAAVNTFCNAIDAAGIRDRFYRLNLFAGSNLSAALVPLYRGQSLGGAQFGNTTDTNNNFVSGDYAETGASGGLTGTGNNGVGAGNSKHLNTGLQPTAWPSISDFHVSAFVFGLNQTGPSQSSPIGIRNNNIPVNRWGFDYRQNSTQFHSGGNLSNSPLVPAVSTDQHLAVSRYSLVLSEGFVNGVSQYTNTTDITATLLARANPFMVFAQNSDTLAGAFFPYRMGGYSLGVSLSESQALALRNAWVALNLTMGRSQ